MMEFFIEHLVVHAGPSRRRTELACSPENRSRELLEHSASRTSSPVPDSTIGQWQAAIERARATRWFGVCREGEAWQSRPGLYMGGASPLVMIQCTGLFESGDAIRNAVHDWKLPLFAIIGYRSYSESGHAARRHLPRVHRADARRVEDRLR
jgi:sulfopyruvate decarboxylase TPP-binding subunit